MAQKEYCCVLSTVDSKELAEEIAEKAVSSRLAAGVNVLPNVSSTYRWKGRIERNEEWLILFYTRKPLTGALSNLIKGLHSYETPAAVSIPIQDGLPAFLDWIGSNTASNVEDY